MPAVAVMIVEADERQSIERQLAGIATPCFCDDVGTLERLVTSGAVEAVLTDLRDKTGASVMPTLGVLRGRWPSFPLVLCVRPTRTTLHEVPTAMERGLGLGVILREFEPVGLAVRRLITPPRPPSAAAILVQRLVPLVPPRLQPFFTVAALDGSPGLLVDDAAAACELTRRTLERWLRYDGLPSAGVALGCCAGLHAAWWLDQCQWPANRVVEEMRFSHLSALTRLLQRYFDCSVKSLAPAGGFEGLLGRFERVLHPIDALG